MNLPYLVYCLVSFTVLGLTVLAINLFLPRLRQRRACQQHALARMAYLFRRNGAIGEQRLALGEINLGAGELQSPSHDHRVILFGV